MAPLRGGFLWAFGRGPAELPRELETRAPVPDEGFGEVPGPKDDWRREEEEPEPELRDERWVWAGFMRRRFGSVEGERVVLVVPAVREFGFSRVDWEGGLLFVGVVELGLLREPEVIWAGREVVIGEEWREERWGCTRRASGLLAIVVEGPVALPERG